MFIAAYMLWERDREVISHPETIITAICFILFRIIQECLLQKHNEAPTVAVCSYQDWTPSTTSSSTCTAGYRLNQTYYVLSAFSQSSSLG